MFVTSISDNTKEETDVTIGVCIKNCEKTIRYAIESIINQDYPHELMEIIVVDGDSKDKTLSIISDMISKARKHINVYFDGGRGLGTARQIVVDNAHSPYIVWVDGDVILVKDLLKEHIRFMNENPKVGVAVGKYMNIKGNLITNLQSMRKQAAYNRYAFRRNLPQPDANGAIYRVEAIRQVGGFDKNIRGSGEDKDLIMRIIKKGWIFMLNEKAKFYHIYRDTWRNLWDEEFWFGYGNHYLKHKHKNLISLWSRFPPISFLDGLRVAFDSFKLTYKIESFLLPILSIYQSLGWWCGFIRGHLDRYGHEIVDTIQHRD